MEKNQTAVFYGALGKDGQVKVGGGETGNNRTIHLLEKNNINVVKVFKPYPVKNIPGYFIYGIKMFFKLFDFIFVLVLNPKVKTIHISGFYQHLIYHEYLLIFIARLFKKKCIYELRGGGVVKAYESRTFIYRYYFRKALNKASVILCQGKSYIEFIEKLTPVKIVYYPNYILNRFLQKKATTGRYNDPTVHLVYFGRIVPSKNPELIIAICSELKLQQFSFDLEIIGEGEDQYVKDLNVMIKDLGMENIIKIRKSVTSEVLQKKLLTKHFFVFPSKEKREGHSNALTESMACGVVPICSKVGFNAEIVKFRELVVQDYDAKKYAERIMGIWENNSWNDFSNKLSERIKNKYSEKVAENIILKVYNT